MDVKTTDEMMEYIGTSLDMILALEEYLNLHGTTLKNFKDWKHNEDLYEM